MTILVKPLTFNLFVKFGPSIFCVVFIKINQKISKISFTAHIVPCGKFHRIGGAPPETFSSEKYDVPEEVGGDRKSFDSPIRK